MGKLAYNFISEGAEEVLSDLTDPLAKYLTGVDKNVGENYNDTIKGLPQTFLVGGSVGTALGAGQDFLRSHSKDQQARGGSAAVRADFYIRTAMEHAENFGSVEDARVEAAILSGYKGASQQLAQMEPEKRAKYLESIGVHKLAFDDKGQLVAKAAENVNDDAVSPALRAISGNLAHAPIAADVQISESAKTAKETVLKAIGKNANVVITDAIEGDNAVYNPDEDVIYISNGALDGSSFNNEDVARAVALHEVAHKAEGTAAYTAMTDELQRILEDENAPADVKALLGDLAQRRAEISELYANEAQSEIQNKYVIKTELVGNMLGDLLGNSYFVERMGARNDGAWKRFISALKAADAGKAAGVTKETQKYLSGLYKSYVKAVDDARQGVKVSAMVGDEEKEKAAEGAVDERRAKKGGQPSREDVVSWTINWDSDNSSDIKGQLVKHLDEINKMPVVANIVYEHASGKDLAQKLDNILRNNFGYKIDNQNYGAITFDAKAINKAINYVNNDAEAAALLAAPYVLKRGKVIGGHKNHKGKGYPSVTFAAPVKINGTTGNVAVAVLYGDKGRVHAVRILDQSGKTFVLEKKTNAESTPAGNTSKKGAMSAINSAPKDSISQKSEKSTENAKKVSDERKSKKVYRRAEASATLEEAVAEHLVFSDAYGKLKGQSKKEATEKLWKAFNTAENGEAQRRAALDVADFVLDNAVVEAFGEDPNAEYYAKQLSVLKGYLRTLNLDGIKEEVRNRFGKDTSPYLLWGKREGKAGVAPDAIKNELIEQGIIITASNPAEIFFEIYDAYKKRSPSIVSRAIVFLFRKISQSEIQSNPWYCCSKCLPRSVPASHSCRDTFPPLPIHR